MCWKDFFLLHSFVAKVVVPLLDFDFVFVRRNYVYQRSTLLIEFVCSVLRFVYWNYIPEKDCNVPKRSSADLKKGNSFQAELKLRESCCFLRT